MPSFQIKQIDEPNVILTPDDAILIIPEVNKIIVLNKGLKELITSGGQFDISFIVSHKLEWTKAGGISFCRLIVSVDFIKLKRKPFLFADV